jgi:hypothetical protein
VSLPGGLRAALASVGDEVAPDRASFLLEVIRRTYDTPLGPRQDRRQAALTALLAQLDAGAGKPDTRDTIPLPLTPQIWIDAVFTGQADAATLVSSILRSRDASLLYYGLLSLDDETRWWLAGQPALIAELASRSSAAFVAAAPALRVSGFRLLLPGGAMAQPVWEALAGRRTEPAADFIRALMTVDQGRLAYFYGALAQLTPAQIRVALHLDAPDEPMRVESGRRLFAVFQQVSRTAGSRAFTRPALDPALLAADLATNEAGEPLVPGTRGLWTAVFKEGDEAIGKSLAVRFDVAADRDAPADFPWLCERIFDREPEVRERQYMMVLFASRRLGQLTRETAGDAVDAIRASRAYPAMTTAIERAGVTDLSVYAGAARRAAALSRIGDDDSAFRALAQFQGALALITRAGARGALTPADASALVSSLAAIETGEDHEYEGRLVTWFRALLHPDAALTGVPSASPAFVPGSAEEVLGLAAGDVERAVLRFLSGPSAADLRMVEWEGTTYRVDLVRAEMIRLTTALGEFAKPWLSSADAAARLADAIGQEGVTREALRQQAELLAHTLQLGCDGERGLRHLSARCRELTATLRSVAGSGNVGAPARLARSLRAVADDLMAQGLLEWAYAAALGRREGVAISAEEAAGRHDFGLGSAARRTAGWLPPRAGTDRGERWAVRGSILGLDVSLADFSVVRLSARPPVRKPTLGEADRRTFIDAVALVQPAFLTEGDRQIILEAMRNGRARVAAASNASDATEIARASGLGASRRTLLAWVMSHEPERLGLFLSPRELLWLGLGDARVGALDAWGVPGSSRLGCLCPQVVGRRPWESFAGRESRGIGASAFPDLNLRLAELLAELHMPAALLAPVLSGATIDFVDSVISRDPDDGRGLLEFVRALRTERVEEYLALLTTDGPLVAVDELAAQTVTRDPSEAVRGAGR